MSVYRPKGKDGKPKSPYYHFDFIIEVDGERLRVHGSTGETTKARAQAAERKERERRKDGRPNDDMTLNAACFRFAEEVSGDQPSADDTDRAFEHCCRLIGGDRKLVNITADDIADAARRRAAETKGKENPKPISKATVNRQIIEPMRRLMRRARRVWGVSCDPGGIEWGAILLKEPTERVRELSAGEGDAFWSALRQDYIPLVWFLAHRGFRVGAALGLTKDRVDLDGRRVQVWMKGKGLEWRPITAEQAAALQTEMARSPHNEVFTYEVQRGSEAGKRYPITYTGLRRTMATTLKAAKIADFRIHDLRHDFATKLLRATRDLALVRKALAHSDIKSTMRYAHVLDEDVTQGMEQMASRIRPGMTTIVPLKKGAK